MRNIVVLLMTAIIMFSCGEQGKELPADGFKIDGKLTNGTGGMIYLDKFGKSASVKVDSSEVAADGSFQLLGTTKGPNIYILHTDKSNFNYLLLDKNEKLEINGDMSNLKTGLTAKNSEGTEQLFELNKRIGTLQIELDNIQQQYEEIKDPEGNKAAVEELRMNSQIFIDNHTVWLKSFIDNNAGSLACIAALYQQIGRQRLISPEKDLRYFIKVDSALMSKYPNNYHVKEYHKNYLAMTGQKRDEQVRTAAIGVGSIAPEITYPDPNGQMRSLSELKGKYVLLDFWAAWCKPCRMESPTLVTNHAKYNKDGFEIFQVSLDNKKEAWIGAIQSDKLSWPYHVSDLMQWKSAPAKLYNVQSIPANFLLDQEGKVIATNLRGPALGQKLAEIFGH